MRPLSFVLLFFLCSIHSSQVESVVKDPTWHTHVRNRIFSSLEVYNFFLDHLSLSSKLLCHLKVAKYQIWREKKGRWRVKSPLGAEGVVWLFRKKPYYRVYLVKGKFSFPLLPTVKGKGVVKLLHIPKNDVLHCQAWFYLRLEKETLHLLGKPAFALLDRWLQREVKQVLCSAEYLAELATRAPKEVYQLMQRVPGISKREREAFFRQVVQRRE